MGVRGLGASLEEAFEGAALALSALTVDLESVSAERRVEFRCQAPDLETLLVDWLNAVVSEMAIEKMVFARFQTQIEDGKLSASGWGESRDPRRHPSGVEVKGASFTELAVAESESGEWIAQCVVDV